MTDPNPNYSHDIKHRTSSRERRCTSKGQDWLIDKKKKNFTRALYTWKLQCAAVLKLMSGTDIKSLKNEVDALRIALSEIRDIYLKLDELDNEVARDRLYQHTEKETNRLTMMYEKHVARLFIQEEVVPPQSRSETSQGTRYTRTSSVRSNSSHQRILDKATKAAALRAKLRYLDLEAVKRAELAKLETTRELEVTEAELEAIRSVEREEGECSDSISQYLSEMPMVNMIDRISLTAERQVPLEPDIHVNFSSTRAQGVRSPVSHLQSVAVESGKNIEPSEFLSNLNHVSSVGQAGADCSSLVGSNGYSVPVVQIPKESVHVIVKPDAVVTSSGSVPELCNKTESTVTSCKNENIEIVSQVSLLIDQMRISRLPVPEPEVFMGDHLKYPGWKSAFHALIGQQKIPSLEKMYYLKKYVGGVARECMEGCFLINSPDSIDEALALLDERFGKSYDVTSAFRDKLGSWPKILPGDGRGLQRLSDFLRQCHFAMKSMIGLQILNDERENRCILDKLPGWLVKHWARIVYDYRGKHDGAFPPFANFVQFISKEAEISCDPVTSVQRNEPYKKGAVMRNLGSGGTRPKSYARVLQSTTSSRDIRQKGPIKSESKESAKKQRLCPLCGAAHDLDICIEFLKMSLTERKSFIRDKRLCFSCLIPNHMSRDCRRRKMCKVCSKRHPSSLHEYGISTEVPAKSMAMSSESSRCSTMIVTVWLSHESDPSNEMLVYALLDTQSDSTFVSSSVMDALGLSGCQTFLRLSTMLSSNQLIESKKYQGLRVRAHDSTAHFQVPTAFSRDDIPIDRATIPTPMMAQMWPHLQGIAPKLASPDLYEVGILIGCNFSQVLAPREVIPAPEEKPNAPFGLRTDLGWSIIGTVPGSNTESMISRPVYGGHEGQDTSVIYTFRTRAKEIISPSEVNRLMERDFNEKSCSGKSLSVEDRRFIDKVSSRIQQVNGKYEMPLPFKLNDPQLPNNRIICEKRCEQLKVKLLKNSSYREEYTLFMKKMIDQGHAEKVENVYPDFPGTFGTTWYIPHHGVYQKTRPDRLRVVFDCSVSFRGKSLNSILLQGPDLTGNLVGLLCRFRKEPVALTCDVEQMFHQFYVSPEHRDFLRFLWWSEGNLNVTPSVYRMNVHLFGASSSPACASFGLKKIADDYEKQHGSMAADFVRSNFYVDDGLISLPTEGEAVQLLTSTTKMCEAGGLRLHKIASNSKTLLNSVPHCDRAKPVKDLDLSVDQLPIEKTLGIYWCMESDTFQFRVTLSNRPLSKRVILSTISSIYDPLGFVAPVVLVGRKILQELCASGCDWDGPVPNDVRSRLEGWRIELLKLKDIKIERCYKSKGFSEVSTIELHHFSDASSSGYGQCSYLRLVDVHGRVSCSLVFGKARVAPRKAVTIPRLELTAAVLSVTVSTMLSRELRYESIQEVFWSDSEVVLGYVKNEKRRFHVYVANRIQAIHEGSDPSQWRHINGKINPADEASRGISVNHLVTQSLWFKGPSFLWERDIPTDSDQGPEVSTDDPEVKRSCVTTCKNMCCLIDFHRYSSWRSLSKVVALCLKYKHILKERISKNGTSQKLKPVSRPVVSLSVEDIQKTELFIVKQVQMEVFENEISMLRSLDLTGVATRDSEKKKKRTLRGSSSLLQLDPFIDRDGVLRVGGRLSRAPFPDSLKHPIILPGKHHVARLLIRHCHELVAHQGRGMTVNEVREHGYWITHCCSEVGRLINSCVTCRKLRGSPSNQKMADLPIDRLTDSPPFTNVAVDYFGPWTVKEGRRQVKRWGVVFTCLGCRAVHLETAASLDTSSFINALRRFLAIRGPIRMLRSDRGTNFVGARREFSEEISKMDIGQVQNYMLGRGCDSFEFLMNPPNASNFGGVWERQIRTIRSVLNGLLLEVGSRLDDECLRTLLSEVSAIVNSRPLSAESLNDPSQRPLSPSQLLTMKSKILLPPPGKFQPTDLYVSKRWRTVQFIADNFWNRWRKEYLNQLQSRQRWKDKNRNLKVGDLVLVNDEECHRSQWPLARVDKVKFSEDGLVRSVTVSIGSKNLDQRGKQTQQLRTLERPSSKLKLILEAE